MCSPGKSIARGVRNPVPWTQPSITWCGDSGSHFTTVGLSPHLHTIPDFCDMPNPVQCNVMNSCKGRRTSPVLMLLGSLSFSSSSCEQTGGSSCVSLTLLSPAASPGPQRVDVPSRICQGISVLSALLLRSFLARDPHFKIEEMKV